MCHHGYEQGSAWESLLRDSQDAEGERRDAARAAQTILRLNGADMSKWTGGLWPDDDALAALRALAEHSN